MTDQSFNADSLLRNTALANAIRFIGIGKHGSKSMPVELIAACKEAFVSPLVNHVQAGAFFGALSVKSKLTAEESELLLFCQQEIERGQTAFHIILPAHPTLFLDEITGLTIKILQGDTLTKTEAETLGAYLFSDDENGDFIRGVSASVMRVRYETDEELEGFYHALVASFNLDFMMPAQQTKTLKVQLAEPFDGSEHSPIITPLLANWLLQKNCLPIIIAGENPGPKFKYNIYELIQELDVPILETNILPAVEDYNPLGVVLDCIKLSDGWSYWLGVRFATIKRPFLSTLEKFLNPCHADILIASVYHITYQEKMVELALMAGFKGAIIMKRGLEGSLVPNTSKSCGILCAIKKEDGSVVKTSFDMSHPAMQSFILEEVFSFENMTVAENAAWITQFERTKRSDNPTFDNYVEAAKQLYGLGLDWIKVVSDEL